jgi:y4mF family transcriptional regulator
MSGISKISPIVHSAGKERQRMLKSDSKIIQDPDELGRVLRARRKVLGLTQIELAQVSGCSAKFLSDLENGKPTIRFDKLLRIVMMLGCDLYVHSRSGDAL